MMRNITRRRFNRSQRDQTYCIRSLLLTTLAFLYWTLPAFHAYLQQALLKIGVKVNLRYEDLPTWLRRIFTHYDFDVTSDIIFTLRANTGQTVRPNACLKVGVVRAIPGG